MPDTQRSYRQWFHAHTLIILLTAIGLVWGWCQLGLRDIRERQELILDLEHRFDAYGLPTTYQPVHQPRWGNRLRLMWLFGASRCSDLNVGQLAGDDASAVAENAELVERARQFFPEATLHLGWHPRQKPAETP
jgi:hypothetical protein